MPIETRRVIAMQSRNFRQTILAGVLLLLMIAKPVRGEEVKRANVVPPTPNSDKEALATELSLANSAIFLDSAAVTWTRKHECGSCHTSYPYLLARPLLKDPR